MLQAFRRLASAGILTVLLAGPAAWSQEVPVGTRLYGIHHEKHGDVGSHKVTFSRSGEDLMVQVENRIKVKVLFITAYRFEADRTELWRDGRLVSYRSETHDDGTDIEVSAEAQDGKLLIDGINGRVEAPGETFPSHPWNQDVLDRALIMDTKTGELKTVQVEAAGEDVIEAGGQSIAARKYVISGDMERELWYGPDGTWLQMRFEKDGSKITFTLQ
jgi:hypothetical protein